MSNTWNHTNRKRYLEIGCTRCRPGLDRLWLALAMRRLNTDQILSMEYNGTL